MKTLRFNFDHPVKGIAMLSPIKCSGGSCMRVKVESLKDNSLEIPISNCNEGQWKLTLDWEHDGRIFSHQEHFEVTKS